MIKGQAWFAYVGQTSSVEIRTKLEVASFNCVPYPDVTYKEQVTATSISMLPTYCGVIFGA